VARCRVGVQKGVVRAGFVGGLRWLPRREPDVAEEGVGSVDPTYFTEPAGDALTWEYEGVGWRGYRQIRCSLTPRKKGGRFPFQELA
jgi:hypothetical protein